MQLVCLESLVKEDHPYRKFSTVLDFEELLRPLKQINNEGKTGATAFAITALFKCLLLQFLDIQTSSTL